LADEEIDKINLKNDKERPLIDSSNNRSAVKKIYYSSSLLVLLVCAFFGFKALILGALMLVLNYIYSMPPIKVSYRGIWAPITLPLGYVFYPYLLGFFASAAEWQNKYLVLLMGLYFAFVGRIFLKDYRDIKGDKKFGKLTFLVRHGNKATALASAIFWLLGATLVGLYFKNYPAFAGIVLIFALAVLYFLYKLSETEKFSQQRLPLFRSLLLLKESFLLVNCIPITPKCPHHHLRVEF
jgi:4-hydroxybenzoate polyprenyltransferase